MIPKILIINGFPLSGKSSFCKEVIKANNNLGEELSMVDLVKKIAVDCGWNGIKTPQDRKYLSDLKDLITTWLDAPFNDVKKQIDKITQKCKKGIIKPIKGETVYPVFINSREPKDIIRLQKQFNAKTIFINRPNVNKELTNHADKNVTNYNYDIIIQNTGEYSQLQLAAKIFLDTLNKEIN